MVLSDWIGTMVLVVLVKVRLPTYQKYLRPILPDFCQTCAVRINLNFNLPDKIYTAQFRKTSTVFFQFSLNIIVFNRYIQIGFIPCELLTCSQHYIIVMYQGCKCWLQPVRSLYIIMCNRQIWMRPGLLSTHYTPRIEKFMYSSRAAGPRIGEHDNSMVIGQVWSKEAM